MGAIDPYIAFSLGALAFGLTATVAMHFYSRRVDRQLERRDR